MNSVRNIGRKRYSICTFVRQYCVKRKYPLDPQHADEMPVFDYSREKNVFRVYSWGYSASGALGHRLIEEKGQMISKFYYPKRLSFAEHHNVIGASAGFGFTSFIVNEKGKHKLYATGLNTDSQIGYHVLKNKTKHLDILLIPQEVNFTLEHEKSRILKVSNGRAHMLVLTDEGLFTFGNNAYGQGGREIIENEQYNGQQYVHPIPNINDEKIVDIEAGQDHSLAITETGKVFSTGWGADGQTGLEVYDTVSKFSRVKGDIEKENIRKISCISDFALALNDKGEVFGWGNTEYGQLPSFAEQQCSKPTHINLGNEFGKIIDIASGGTFCLLLNSEGKVFVWGFGLLGLGPEVNQQSTPTQLPETLFGQNEFNTNNSVVSVAAGLFHAAAVTSNGELYMWGRNKCGCLGFGDDKPQYFPLKVAVGASVQHILCGADHTVALCESYA